MNSLSISEIIQNGIKTFPVQTFLTNGEEKLLSTKFIPKYILLANSIPKFECPESSHSLEVSEISSSDEQLSLDFVEKNFFAAYEKMLSPKALSELKAATPEYFKRKLYGFKYRKNGNLVGLLLANLTEKHPIFEIPVIHIGYWGYEKSELTIKEARFIKAHWRSTIHKLSSLPNIQGISATINTFNEKSLNLAKTLGFTLKYCRLDDK